MNLKYDEEKTQRKSSKSKKLSKKERKKESKKKEPQRKGRLILSIKTFFFHFLCLSKSKSKKNLPNNP